MTDAPPRRLSRPRIALMVAIDVVALAIGLFLFVWLKSRDTNAALMALIAPLVFAAFFNLVIVLVSLRP